MSDMLVSLYQLPDPAALRDGLKDRGILIRTAMAYEKHQVVDWVRTTFSDAWAAETDVAFSNQPISCFIAVEEGQLVGFACHDSTCKNFFGPTGVFESHRGQGIGKALLLSCLHAMATAGYGYAIIGGAGAPEFYGKSVGATPIEGSCPGIYPDRLRPNKPRERAGPDE